MNSNIAKQRLSEVVRIDTITSSQGDFLATHVPVKKLQLLKRYDSNTISSSDKTYSEEEIYRNVVLNPKNKKTYTLLAEEWKEYYDRKATSIISMLDTVKGIATDKNKLQYAINKIKKGSGWNTDISNLQYMKNGLLEAKGIMDELALDDSIIQFLRLVSDGKATIDDLSQEILNWISKENLSGKLFVRFAE